MVKMRKVSLTLCAVLFVMAIGDCSNALGSAEISAFSVEGTTSQAGGHPNIAIHARFGGRYEGEFQEPSPETCQCEDAKSVNIELPTGFIGNPSAIPQCTLADFSLNECPVDTQVGNAELRLFNTRVPIFNLVPRAGEPGLTGFMLPVVEVPFLTTVHARTGSDYGLDVSANGFLHLLPTTSLDVYLWGVPAAASNDPLRFPADVHKCVTQFLPYPDPCLPPISSDALPVPFLSNPTTCGESLTAGLEVAYYSGVVKHAEATMPPTSGCDRLGFRPSLTARPTAEATDSASGLDIDLKVPQPMDQSVPSPSQIRTLNVALPPGLSLNPGAADGKTSCADSQLNFNTEEAAECPEYSKIGTLELESSVLPQPLPGSIYIGQPTPEHQFRLFLTANGFGTHVKLKGEVELDPGTGQISVVFRNLPQSPFQDFNMHFFGSERGIFATPSECGTYPVRSEFIPWDSVLTKQTSLSVFNTGTGPGGGACPVPQRPFAPRFTAGTSDNTADSVSPLSLRIERSDGDQNLSGIETLLPPGITPSLEGVEQCPQADIDNLLASSHTGLAELASASCPTASLVGRVTAASGPGTRPIYNRGKMYFAGPYKGAPFSLVIVVPAVGGPYDLGNAVVRVATYVNPVSAQVRALSDVVPSILSGVPLRLRSLQLEFDRPGFIHLPTNCDPMAITAKLTGSEGANAERSTPFQVANCGNIPFGPTVALRFTGSTKRTGDPALHAKILAGYPYEANPSRLTVQLPSTEIVDNAHIRNPCTRVVFFSTATPGEHCSAGSRVGFGSAVTPFLNRPLEGPVYLRSDPENKSGLPDLVLALNGQVFIETAARIKTVHGRLQASFANLPDVFIASADLTLYGGRKGVLENNTDLCVKPRYASASLVSYSKTVIRKPLVRMPCGPGTGGSKQSKNHGRTGNRSKGHK